MKTKISVTAVLLCCFAVCFAATSNINGKWTGLIKTPYGAKMPVTYTFKADSGKISGTAKAPQGTASITNGKIDGDEFSFGVAVSNMHIEHTAKYFSAGDSVSMDIDFKGQTYHATLKRADNP